MISRRTCLSLAQFLVGLQEPEFVRLLLEKHNISYVYGGSSHLITILSQSLTETAEENIHSLLGEMARTPGDLRSRVTPRYRYDERFADLERCLLLDGYIFKNANLVPLDPTILEIPPLDDDLTQALGESGLPGAEMIIRKLSHSVEAFRKSEPDLNASLNDARVALQTLATAIANVRRATHPGNYDEKKWGAVLAYLRTSGFVTEDQEKGLAGVFGFVSPGSHVPLGLTEIEMARLGRSFIAGMCWFLVKRYKG